MSVPIPGDQRHVAAACRGTTGSAATAIDGGRMRVVRRVVVCLAADGDDILTSDPGDLRALAQAAGVPIELIPV